MFSTHLFGEPVIIASGAENAKLVLQNEGSLFQPAYPAELTGNTSAPAIHGEQWKAWRRFAISKVGSGALKDRINTVEDFALNTLSTWEGRRVLVGEEARSVRILLHENVEIFPKHLDIQILYSRLMVARCDGSVDIVIVVTVYF